MLEILNLLPEILQKVYKEKLKSVILFGSYARGTYDAESDVDIAVLIDGTEEEMEDYKRQLSDISAEFIIQKDCNWLFSLIPIQFSRYEEWKEILPFYKNISQEGIVLYVSH